MNYALAKGEKAGGKISMGQALKKLLPYLSGLKKELIISAAAVLVNTVSTLLAPVIVSRVIDSYIRSGDMAGVLRYSAYLLGVFLIGLFGNYMLTMSMGAIGREILWKMRSDLFNKLQELPQAFFNQNQAGDLISRVNNDTDKLNTLFAQVLVQFVGSIFLTVGTGAMMVVFNMRLGLATLLPAAMMLVATQALSGWLRSRSLRNLQAVGAMSAEIQEGLGSFRVIAAFNRRDFFRKKFAEANEENYTAAKAAGISSGTLAPLYGLASALAQIIAVAFGAYLIVSGGFTVGALIGFLIYVNGFYAPLRQIAALWSVFQTSLSSLDRIYDVLSLGTDLAVIPAEKLGDSARAMEFRDVSFAYPDGQEVLKSISLSLEKGKTYALVGPTGGGKTTTASLMARLYDPTSGSVLVDGQDIRSLSPNERAKKIGFILQDPFIFTGTVRDNLTYGNDEYGRMPSEELMEVLAKMGLAELIARLGKLDDAAETSGGGMSLGQKQIIAFIRAVLRKPELLILDEATANIDTVTERALQSIVEKIPAETTKVIIAHRLNTIKDADEIFFVNSGEVVRAGSMEHAVDLLMHGKRKS